MSETKHKKNLIISVIFAVLSVAIGIADFALLNVFPEAALFSVYCVLPFSLAICILLFMKIVNTCIALCRDDSYKRTKFHISRITTILLIVVLVMNPLFESAFLFSYSKSNISQNYIETMSNPNSTYLCNLFNISDYTNISEDENSVYTPVSFYSYSHFLSSESMFLSKDFTTYDTVGEQNGPIRVSVEFTKNTPRVFNAIRYQIKKMSVFRDDYDTEPWCIYYYELGDYEDRIVTKGTEFSLLSKDNHSFLYVTIETYDQSFRIDDKKAIEIIQNIANLDDDSMIQEYFN